MIIIIKVNLPLQSVHNVKHPFLKGILKKEQALAYLLPSIRMTAQSEFHTDDKYLLNPSLTLPSKWISTNLPNRLLLLFLTVLAFPKASSKGFAGEKKNQTSACNHLNEDKLKCTEVILVYGNELTLQDLYVHMHAQNNYNIHRQWQGVCVWRGGGEM